MSVMLERGIVVGECGKSCEAVAMCWCGVCGVNANPRAFGVHGKTVCAERSELEVCCEKAERVRHAMDCGSCGAAHSMKLDECVVGQVAVGVVWLRACGAQCVAAAVRVSARSAAGIPHSKKAVHSFLVPRFTDTLSLTLTSLD